MGFCVNRNNITVSRFDYGVDIIWKAQDSNGTPVDITGCDVQIIIKKNFYQPDSAAIYDQIVSADGSDIILPLSKELTSNPAGTYSYGLRLIENGEFVDTLMTGQFIIATNVFSEAANG